MPYNVRVEGSFAAAHALRGYGGSCERVHGHNFKVTLDVLVEGLNDIGIALDFKVLRAILDNILDELDHTDLNATPFFETRNATAENLARFIYEQGAAAVAEKGGRLASVTVEESSRYAATYLP